MNKILSLLLVVAIVLSLCACGASEGTPENVGLQAGFARINTTPSYSVCMAGYSDDSERRSDGFRTFLFMTCIAVKTGNDTALMYTFDGLNAPKDLQKQMRSSITAAVDVPADNIFIGATHCHSAPTMSSAFAGNDKYMKEFMKAAADAAQQAIADLAPAQMLTATPTITDENGKYMNFVRHYEMADGTHAGSNFGDFSKEIVGHSAESDPQMVLIKFDRPEDKKDILMMNWQAHPDSGSALGRYQLAASWVGPLRDELESLSGLQVAYFTGASGNQNMDSEIPEEAHKLSWDAYGKKMGQLTYAALSELKPVETTDFTFKQTNQMLTLDIDHSWDYMLDQANEVFDLWKSAGKSAGDALGKTYNFSSSYQARAIRSRANMGATDKMEIRAFRIGPVGFITGTYEMFSTQGLYVKENSPYDVTFLITGNFSYLPDKEAYIYRSYEADTGYFASGSAEKLAEAYVQMLKDIQ